MVRFGVNTTTFEREYYEKRSMTTQTTEFILFLLFIIITSTIITNTLKNKLGLTIFLGVTLVLIFIFLWRLNRSKYLVIRFDLRENRIEITRKSFFKSETRKIEVKSDFDIEFEGIEEVIELTFLKAEINREVVGNARVEWMIVFSNDGSMIPLISHENISLREIKGINQALMKVFTIEPKFVGVIQKPFKIPVIEVPKNMSLIKNTTEIIGLSLVVGIPALSAITLGFLRRGSARGYESFWLYGVVLAVICFLWFFAALLIIGVIAVPVLARTQGIYHPNVLLAKNGAMNFYRARELILYFHLLLVSLPLMISISFLNPILEFMVSEPRVSLVVQVLSEKMIYVLSGLFSLALIAFIFWVILFPVVIPISLYRNKKFIEVQKAILDLNMKLRLSQSDSERKEA